MGCKQNGLCNLQGATTPPLPSFLLGGEQAPGLKTQQTSGPWGGGAWPREKREGVWVPETLVPLAWMFMGHRMNCHFVSATVVLQLLLFTAEADPNFQRVIFSWTPSSSKRPPGVVLTLQQHQHRLGTWQTCKFSGPTADPLIQPLGLGLSGVCFHNLPKDSNMC